MGKANRDDYRFLKIADALVALNQKVNVIGVVAEYSVPKRSKGTDWFCSLRIVDESHHSPGLLVNVFAESVEKLPQVGESGDILQLSLVEIKTHNGAINAIFNKKFSSFALYGGKYDESCNPYQASSKFRSRDQDMTFVVGLRKWMDGFQLDTVSKAAVLLRQLEKEGLYDVVCKILHASEVSKDEWMLYVWDGSDVSPLPIQAKLENEMQRPLPLQLEPDPLPREMLCTFPVVGTVLRVSVDQRNVKLNVPSLSTGRWVKFIDLTFEVHEGLWRGVITPSTKVRFVPNEDSLVLERQRNYEKRLSSKWDRMPFESFPWPARITEVDADVEAVPIVSLMKVLTYSQVTAKFRCIVRVVAAVPWKVEDFLSPQRIYRVRVTLEDPTARIHAYLYAEDGEKFFDGYPPVNELTRKWKKLLGVAEADSGGETKEAPRNPPWVQCCIKSYYIDENDVWGSRRYRIFKTKLAC